MQLHRNNRGVSMVEMLVVIIVLGILASILLPSLQRVRRYAQTAKCVNRMRQLTMGVQQYVNDFKIHPPWLSTLYDEYINSEKLFICPTDTSTPPGSEGARDDNIPPELFDQFAELDDNLNCDTSDAVYVGLGRYGAGCELVDAKDLRTDEIEYNSYSYEFACPTCTWWQGGDFPDKLGNADGVISWREVKIYSEQEGYIDEKRNVDPQMRFGGRVPLIRCFWHTPAYDYNNMDKTRVLNIASGDFNVYWSIAKDDGWQYDWSDF